MTVRMHCIEITINPDLTTSYRLTLPIKEQHRHLFDVEQVVAYVKKGKIRYHYEYKSFNREAILQAMMSAQLLITDQKIVEMRQRKEMLLSNLSIISIS